MLNIGLFKKLPLPDQLPGELQQIVDDLKDKPPHDIARGAYDAVTERFGSGRALTYLRLPELLIKDINRIWNKSDFCHCTHQNYLIRLILIKTGRFTENDIRLKLGMVWWWSPHQWLSVRVGDDWIDIDPWGRSYGVPFGKNGHGTTSSAGPQWVK